LLTARSRKEARKDSCARRQETVTSRVLVKAARPLFAFAGTQRDELGSSRMVRDDATDLEV
jgi:hypothetical protein